MKNAAFVCTLLGVVCSFSVAAVGVGDTPEMKFKSATGSESIDLAGLRGKIVVIDFWATWCGPCMAEAEHMVSLNEKYSPQGLQMIGISLDQNAGALKNVVKAKKFEWPQHFDGKGWQNKFAQEWGVNSIPRTFILNPEGKVVWSGHPASIDSPLEKAFKQTPPRLVDAKVIEAANGQLEQVNAAVASGDNSGAIRMLAAIPADAKKDPDLARRADEAASKLAAAADAEFAAAEELVAQKKYGDATTKLEELSQAFSGQPAGDKAARRLRELNNLPDARAAIQAAARSSKADDALAAAQQLKDEQKDIAAYGAFRKVVGDFPDTDAAAKAQDAAKAYESDAAFMQKYNEAVTGPKAKSALSMAESYLRAGKKDLARKKYQSVVDEFPGTQYAEQAKKALADIK